MKLSPAGLALIKDSEGLRLMKYIDAAGKATIGWGHRCTGREPDIITVDQADALLTTDVAQAEEAINDLVHVPLTQGQFDALCDFVYNVGRGDLAHSTLRRKLNMSDYLSVPAELRKWVNAGGHHLEGLVRRREAEIALWNGQ